MNGEFIIDLTDCELATAQAMAKIEGVSTERYVNNLFHESLIKLKAEFEQDSESESGLLN